MFDTVRPRVIALRQAKKQDDHLTGADALKRRCLHPAEAWVMKRRAGRPQAASRRLPAVARAG